ncbi:MAG: ABC transporter ATP-binding protein [Chloroflexota bacterium]|nr:ABC transporter ATP-binding protein [Chloroflexota bacterium]
MPPIIEVENLVKRYRKADTNAVDGVSFSVQPGELFTLLGPNGAGKTTTISILTTTLAPTAGSVRIAGHELSTEQSAVRKSVGIIFQKPSLDMNLTAEENVRFHAIMYGLYPFRPFYAFMPRAYKEQVAELATILGIEGEIFKPVKTFSGGMKRKLEIIRSLIHRPTVLFLDEPTLGLDPASRRSLWEYLRRVRRESGTTLFLTTHYLEEAEEADTICVINRGKIVSQGTPEQIKSDLIDEYLLLDAADRDSLRSELQRLEVPFTETPQFKIPVNGIRPQAIIKAIDTPLTVLQVHMPTLEDAYLAIVEKQAATEEREA